MDNEVIRRAVLQALGTFAAAVALSRVGFAAQGANPGSRLFRGLFPKASTSSNGAKKEILDE
jgi:hypothetical protein